MSVSTTAAGNNTTLTYTKYELSGTTRITFAFTASVALIENIIVVFMFWRRPRWLSKPHNRCILNLAVIDILTTIIIFTNPYMVLSEHFYKVSSHSSLAREMYCRLLWSHYLPFALAVTSLYISVVLSFERWLAVTKSIFYRHRFNTRHMNLLIASAWVIAFVIEIPVITLSEGVYNHQKRPCTWKYPDMKVMFILLIGQTVLPFTLIFAAYFDIFRAIRASVRFASTARNGNNNCRQRLKKVTIMTATATVVLLICWMPASLYFFVVLLGHLPMVDLDGESVMYFRLLVFSNSCLNPCVYVFSNPEYRKVFKELFCSFSLSKLFPLQRREQEDGGMQNK